MRKTTKAPRFAVAAATCAVAAVAAAGLAGCGSSEAAYQIGVPSDVTNEARALLLLQDQGLITLADDAGLEATANDIVDNPYNIEIVEMEAAQVPSSLPDLALGVINGNYAISAGIDTTTALATESVDSDAAEQYVNVVAVRSDNAASDKIAALVAALQTQAVADFIEESYDGAVVPVFDAVDESEVPDATGDDTTIRVGASPAPHAEILAQIKDLLSEHGWTLEVVEFNDYIQPNVALEDGELDANYFQHITYLENYNDENGTDLVAAAGIHFEPLGLYPGTVASLATITG